jgi:8-oxo-dGTP pyrophosphatase MutT (NUDIX family)
MTKRGFGQGKWNGVGGKVDNESVEEAAKRETAEEVGVDVAELEKVAILTFYFTDPKCQDWNQEVHVFLTRSWEGEPSESEEMKPRWFVPEEIPFSSMWADDPFWLPKVLTGEKLRAVFTFSDSETITEHEINPWE